MYLPRTTVSPGVFDVSKSALPISWEPSELRSLNEADDGSIDAAWPEAEAKSPTRITSDLGVARYGVFTISMFRGNTPLFLIFRVGFQKHAGSYSRSRRLERE